ncbi:MAG: copper resistance protein CopC [Chloroflexota bacterium]|nr:copper resistance protein CopC [Chloroflexota bacterium]
MKIKSVLAGTMLLAATLAQAHTHLESSVPVDKGKVAAPVAIELHFSEAARVTALTLQQGTSAARPLTPLPAKTTQHVSVPVANLTAGDYTVNWRVAGEDGHVVSGKFSFTVDPSAPAATARPSPEKKPAGSPEHQH